MSVTVAHTNYTKLPVKYDCVNLMLLSVNEHKRTETVTNNKWEYAHRQRCPFILLHIYNLSQSIYLHTSQSKVKQSQAWTLYGTEW